MNSLVQKVWIERGAVFLALIISVGFYNCKHTATPPQPPVVTVDTFQVTTPQATPNWCCKALAPLSQQKNRPPSALGAKGYYWPTGSNFHIKLLGGTKTEQDYVRAAFTEWMKYANFTVDYPTAGPYDCRVAFDPSLGAWSYIGTDNKTIPQSDTTMNIGWTGLDVAEHEIGHFLGLLHEQSSPNGGVCWNKTNVNHDLSGPPNYWNQSTIDNNVYYVYPANQVDATPFDKVSIMEYPIQGSWTCSGVAIPGGVTISDVDKTFISLRYPGRVAPPIVTPGITLTAKQTAALKTALNDASNSIVAAKKLIGQ